MQQLPYDGAYPHPCFIGWYTDWCIFEEYFHQNVYFQVSALGLNFGGKFKSRRDHRFPPIRCDEIQSQFQTSWLNIFRTTFQKGIWIEIPFPEASFSHIICTKSNYSQQSKLDWKLGRSAACVECNIKNVFKCYEFCSALGFSDFSSKADLHPTASANGLFYCTLTEAELHILKNLAMISWVVFNSRAKWISSQREIFLKIPMSWDKI